MFAMKEPSSLQTERLKTCVLWLVNIVDNSRICFWVLMFWQLKLLHCRDSLNARSCRYLLSQVRYT